MKFFLACVGAFATLLATWFCIRTFIDRDGWAAIAFIYVITPSVGGYTAILTLVLWILSSRDKDPWNLGALVMSAIATIVLLVEAMILMSTPMAGC